MLNVELLLTIRRGEASNFVPLLRGLAPGGVYRARAITVAAVSSYLAFSPLLGGCLKLQLTISRRAIVNAIKTDNLQAVYFL